MNKLIAALALVATTIALSVAPSQQMMPMQPVCPFPYQSCWTYADGTVRCETIYIYLPC
jgi:hypothetical protein